MISKIGSVTVGVIVSLLAIYQLHNFLLVDACLDSGGQYQRESALCLGQDGYEHTIVLSDFMLFVYFIVGLAVSVITAYLVHKLLSKKGGNHGAT